MTDQYKQNFERGLEYQDFVADRLLKGYGIAVNAYSSRKYQQEYGESASGIEIKFDAKSINSENLYIETAEKTNVSNAEYVSSGIFREDNSWLYLIGNYKEAYLFSKEQLKRIYHSKNLWEKRGIREVETGTSQGFLFPKKQAIELGTCIKLFIW